MYIGSSASFTLHRGFDLIGRIDYHGLLAHLTCSRLVSSLYKAALLSVPVHPQPARAQPTYSIPTWGGNQYGG